MKARLKQNGLHKLLNWQHGIYGKKSLPHSVNALEFGFYLKGSQCEAFGWKGMTSPSTTINGMLKRRIE